MRLESVAPRDEAPPEHIAVFVAPPAAVSILRAVLSQLPVDFPAAIDVLLHAGTGLERPVADNLNVSSSFMVMPGVDGLQLRNNRAYVVLPAQNLAIGGDGRLTAAYGADADSDAILLGNDATLPSAEVLNSEPLLSSLASRYGSGAIAIALTAVDAREAEGFRRVREAGGHTIALDESERLWADSSGPRVVPAPADELLPAAAIGKRMLEMLMPALAAAR